MKENAIRRTIKRTNPGKTSIADDSKHDPLRFIEEEFHIPELRGPIKLQEYQKIALKEVYRRDGNGHFVYSIVLWSDIKKSAKSSIAAAVCLERAAHSAYASVKIIANDLKQADSRVAYYLRRAIDLNPRLKAQVKTRLYRTTLWNKSTIEAIPIDPTGEAGGNDDLICFSELWGARGEAAKRMWTEMTLSPTKYGISQRWIETYAGYSGESELLEQLYNTGVTEGRLIETSIPGLELYANDAAHQLTLWNTQPRCPWQTNDYYAQESAVLPPEEFDRVHRNKWASALSPFVRIEWWDACKVSQLKEMDRYREVCVGIDAAVSDDCFAVVTVSREERAQMGAAKSALDYVAIREVRIWYPPKGGKMQYSNPEDPRDPEFPEGYIRSLAEKYNVIDFAYDPYQLHHLCTSLQADNVGAFTEITQGGKRLEADKQLYDLIRDRRVAHDGNTELRSHIENSSKQVDGTTKLRIVKRTEAKKIDAAVALSMAAFQALKLLSV